MPLSPPDSLKNDLLTLFAEGDRPPTPARSPRTGERKHDSGLKLLVEGERGWDYMCNEDMMVEYLPLPDGESAKKGDSAIFASS